MSLTPAELRERRSHRAWLWAIVLVGIVCRVVGVLLLAGRFSFPDAGDYDALAKAIALGQDYIVNGATAARMPGYPAFVSNFYMAFGPNPLPVLLGQAVLSGVTGLLVYALAKEFSPRAGRMAAGLFAVDPLTIGFAATLLSETLFTTLLLLTLWLALRAVRSCRWEDWLAMGLVAPVATYVRGEAYWLVVPLGAAALWATLAEAPTAKERWGAGRLGVGLTGWMASILILMALLHPWQARNATLYPEAAINLTSLEGISLYEAVYPEATGGPMQDKIKLPREMITMNEGQKDAAWKQRAWEEIRSNPRRVARLAVLKVGRMWSPWMNATEMRNGWVQAGLTLWHGGLYVLAIAALVMGWRKGLKGAVMVLLVPLLYLTAVHAVYVGSVRYRVPVMPVVHVFAAVGLSWVIHWRAGRKGPQREASERV